MTAIRIAAILGFLAVTLGAFGAHGLENTLKANGRMETWQTAVLYHMVHAVVMLAVAFQLSGSGGGAASPAFWLFGVGILIFSGTLYLLSLTNVKWLGAITPIGGLFLLAGWLYLALKGVK